MVCIRCEMVVRSELEKAGIPFYIVRIGMVEMPEHITAEQRERLNMALKKSGLELLDDKKSILVEKIKNVIIELVHYNEDRIRVNLSDYLSEKLNYDYTYLANLFAEVKGTTIEQFFIFHRIERTKELLVYDELSLSEISDKLHFSNPSHLCKQFKKITGLTPTHFRKLNDKQRGPLENV